MRRLLQRLLKKTIIRLSDKYSTRPDKARVEQALSKLYQSIINGNTEKGKVLNFDAGLQKFIIFSDQHKGARNGDDDFAKADRNYIAALNYYNIQHFHYINLGDSEELWKNTFLQVKKHNKATFEAEQQFLVRNAFTKIFGNHDLYWDNSPLALLSLQQVYGQTFKVYEGMVLTTTVADKPLSFFLTHGHQGDRQSDGNWFSKWFVSSIWGPVEGYLRINPNTPANNYALKTAHNQMMYEWSAHREDTVLITGHTHQPVFKSLTHLEKLYDQLDKAKVAGAAESIKAVEDEIKRRHIKGDSVISFNDYKPTYFNSGCCCYDDGDITGIEIEDGKIRLIKWEYHLHKPKRFLLEECELKDLI